MNAPITVIIPVYNSEATIEECINSVLHQSIMPQQIIVVDDGSTDNSLDKINKFDNSSLIKVFLKKIKEFRVLEIWDYVMLIQSTLHLLTQMTR